MKNSLILILLFASLFTIAQNITAKIILIKDGDTVEMLFEGKPLIVRLAHIDCPEKNQPFGMKAKQFASDFCFGKMVKVSGYGKKDRNGRWIAEIFYKNQNLGKELVRNGLAWHFKKYSRDAAYAELEIIARQKRAGLWQDSTAMPPWEWRKVKKTKKLPAAA